MMTLPKLIAEMTIAQLIAWIKATQSDFVEALNDELIEKKELLDTLKFFSAQAKKDGWPLDTPFGQILNYYLEREKF